MSSNKRKMSGLFESEEENFHVKKKNSLLSLETTDSLSKEDHNLSPIVLKPYHSEPFNTPDHSSIVKDKLSDLKVPTSTKKKGRSAHINSYQEICKNYLKDPSTYVDTFKAFKYKDYKYRLETFMLVRNEADPFNDFVCKLIRIIKPKKVDSRRILAFLEVQWYYKKEDLPKKFAPYMDYLSVYEVFLSSHKDFIMIDCINGPCQVLSFEEFDNLETVSSNTYFSRAAYDIAKKKLEPSIDKWNKTCICKTPLNPDHLYIQCDKCNGWYHLECVGISYEKVKEIEQYYCSNCENNKTPGEITLSPNLCPKKKKEKKKLRMKKALEAAHQSHEKKLKESMEMSLEGKIRLKIHRDFHSLDTSFLKIKNKESVDDPPAINFVRTQQNIEEFENLLLMNNNTTNYENSNNNKEVAESQSNNEEEEEHSSPKIEIEINQDISVFFSHQNSDGGGANHEGNSDIQEDMTMNHQSMEDDFKNDFYVLVDQMLGPDPVDQQTQETFVI